MPTREDDQPVSRVGYITAGFAAPLSQELLAKIASLPVPEIDPDLSEGEVERRTSDPGYVTQVQQAALRQRLLEAQELIEQAQYYARQPTLDIFTYYATERKIELTLARIRAARARELEGVSKAADEDDVSIATIKALR